MARIKIRAAVPRDVQRIIADGLVGGALPPGETWENRINGWLAEMQAGRRLVMVIDEGKHLMGTAQILFKLAGGATDPEACNGVDIWMIEGLRFRSDATSATATHFISELEHYAKQHRAKALTYRISMDNNKALAQVKGWGFQEFRIMPEGGRLMAFFKKDL